MIHVVGPMRTGQASDKECADVLKKAFDNVLEEATQNKFTSIALPGVSAGEHCHIAMHCEAPFWLSCPGTDVC